MRPAGRPTRAFYRLKQGLHALLPRVGTEDAGLAHRTLSKREAALFFAMEKRDQRHALAVARRLEADGAPGHDLLVAALLHDCAKGSAPVWLRASRVLSPGLLRRFAREGAAGWRGAAYRLHHDARLGAELAAAAGASAVAVRLIAGCPDPEDEAAFALLSAADDSA